jgi:hypothetical protein
MESSLISLVDVTPELLHVMLPGERGGASVVYGAGIEEDEWKEGQ